MTIRTKSSELTADNSGTATAEPAVNGILRGIIIKPKQTNKPLGDYLLDVKMNDLVVYASTTNDFLSATANKLVVPTTASQLFPVSGLLKVVAKKVGTANQIDVETLIEI